MKKLLLTVCVLALAATSVSTEQGGAKAFALTVDNIMRGPELVGNPTNKLRWSGDSVNVHFQDSIRLVQRLIELRKEKQ